jgi:hypothetical protein
VKFIVAFSFGSVNYGFGITGFKTDGTHSVLFGTVFGSVPNFLSRTENRENRTCTEPVQPYVRAARQIKRIHFFIPKYYIFELLIFETQIYKFSSIKSNFLK